MPEIKLLKLPSSKGTFLQEQGGLDSVCSSRRRSCALVNTPAPCVNKAVCHIKELKSKLEHWGQKGGETQHENNHSNVWKAPGVSAELCVEGLKFCAPGSEATPLWKETVDVLAEVMCLIERLELDRREAEKALLEETEKAEKLLLRQDSLAHWKKQEFPIVMQKEHDACGTDIADLTWQLTISRDQQSQVRDRLTRTEALNRRLRENIDFMRKHGPLVGERLQMENEIMKQILATESETSETFTRVSEDLKALQQKFKQEKFRADAEKQEMDGGVETMRKQLCDKMSDLHQLQSQCEIFHTSIKKSEEKVTLKDNQIKILLQETRRFERQQTDIYDAVTSIKAKTEDKEEAFMKTKKRVLRLQNQIQTTKHEGDEKISELHLVLSQKRQELSDLRAQNEDHKLQIEDYEKKIRQSEQAVRQLLRDQERLLLKTSLNEEQRKTEEAELERVSEQHSCVKAELDHLEQQSFLEELRNRKHIELLKTQITEEIKVTNILKENVSTLTSEYNDEQTHCEQVKAELQEKFEDVSSTSAQLETTVEHLKRTHMEKSQTIEEMRAKLGDMHTSQKHLTDEFEKKKEDLQKHLNSVKENLQVLSLRSEKMSSKIMKLRLKTEELNKASDTLEKTINRLPDFIAELRSISDTAAFKHGTARAVMGNLQRDMTSCEERKSRHAQIHSALFTQRQAALKDTEANLQKALKDNLLLAQEYKSLQKSLTMARQEAVCAFDKRNMAETDINNHKQLSLLQKRMHKAMLKHFKHRSVHSQAGLARFQTLSNQNNQQMKALQEELSSAIRCLSEFLLALTDGSSVRHEESRTDAGASSRTTLQFG